MYVWRINQDANAFELVYGQRIENTVVGVRRYCVEQTVVSPGGVIRIDDCDLCRGGRVDVKAERELLLLEKRAELIVELSVHIEQPVCTDLHTMGISHAPKFGWKGVHGGKI